MLIETHRLSPLMNDFEGEIPTPTPPGFTSQQFEEFTKNYPNISFGFDSNTNIPTHYHLVKPGDTLDFTWLNWMIHGHPKTNIEDPLIRT
jgi:hypothetical protein